MSKLSSRWVPRLLSAEHKRNRLVIAKESLALLNANKNEFLRRFVTVDEIWIHHHIPESKEQSKQWISTGETAPKKAKIGLSANKMMMLHPTPAQRVSIREELREPEDPADIERDIKLIREWLETQPHLPKDMDDMRLTTFLRGCKFSLEKVKKKLDMYYTMRNAVPEFFSNRDINREELNIVLDYVHCPTLPGITPNGRRITFIRGIDCDFQPHHILDAMKVALMIGDVRLAEESMGIAGDVFILDAAVASASHFAKFSPTVVKKFLIAVQEAYPVKVKEVHVINISPLVDTIFNFVKPFVKEKIRSRITFHNDVESLYKVVPRDLN
ncbi:hypothetical protein ACLKA7_008206 [Drosophila subpalustris]